MDIYDKIDRILEQKNLSRRKLAIIAKIPPTTLQSAFSRKTENLPFDTIKRIAEVLEVTPFDLIGASYWDITIGKEELEKMHNDLNLIELVEKQHGKIASDAIGLFIELNLKGQEKALEYISDLYDQSKYKKD